EVRQGVTRGSSGAAQRQSQTDLDVARLPALGGTLSGTLITWRIMDRRLYDEIRNIEADHWWYVGRRRIVFDWIRLAAASYTNPRVLDLGCGTGFNAEQL